MRHRSITAALCALLACLPAQAYPRARYMAHDGTWTRRPHVYRRHPNVGTKTAALCRDGATSFSHTRSGTCSSHGGVQEWR